MNINQKGTIIVHSSMKSIGSVNGGADAVLDTLSTFMKDGLLVFPIHTHGEMSIKTNRNFMLEVLHHI